MTFLRNMKLGVFDAKTGANVGSCVFSDIHI